MAVVYRIALFLTSILFSALHFPDVSSPLLSVLFSELITELTSSVLCLLPLHQRGRLRDSADESGLGELRHTAALCPAGEQDPAALAPAGCAHRSGRGCGGCKNTTQHLLLFNLPIFSIYLILGHFPKI